MRTRILSRIKDAVNLLLVQKKFGLGGIICQFVYPFLGAIKSLFPVYIFKIIIDVCETGKTNYLIFVLMALSLVSWITDAIYIITERVRTIYNLKFAHFFKRKICLKAVSMDYADTENSASLDEFWKAMDAAYYGLSDSLFSETIVSLFKLVVLLITLSTLNIWITIAAFLSVMFIYFINSFATKKNLNFEMDKSHWKRQKEYSDNCIRDIFFAKDIRLFCIGHFLKDKYIQSSESELIVIKKQNRFNLLITICNSLINISVVCSLYIVLIKMYTSNLLIISSFTMYTTAFSKLYESLTGIFSSLLGFKESSYSLSEVDKVVNKVENINNSGSKTIDHIDTIEFKNVFFTYPGQTNPAIENVSFKINKGEKVILVGENGAGKTTLVKLLLRLYEVERGEILVNGIKISDIKYENYISRMSACFQEVKLFSYSVRENISFSNFTEDNAIIPSTDFSGLSDYIFSLKDGLDTFCSMEFDEKGVNFSGGEQQKIAISRSVFKENDVISMDEPNSSLDAISEKYLSDSICNRIDTSATVLISHRMSLCKYCDKILVFKNGHLVQQGDHKTLLKIKNGLYYSMWSDQANNYLSEIKDE